VYVEVRLPAHLAVYGPGEPQEEQGTQEPVEEYFDTFVQGGTGRVKINFLLVNETKIILGVDPGTVIMGYGLLAIRPQGMEILKMDAVKLNGKRDMFERLSLIHQTISGIIGAYRPDELAIEAPFFGKNVQSMLKLGRAQGIAIAVAMQHGLPVTEYSPKKIKQSITGNGNAGKEQVWEMLQRWLPVTDTLRYFDASDAIAVALCHHFHQQGPVAAPVHGRKKKGWDDFIRENPHRLAG
jgi:crossover junction endodeoxyribonuclease RuvC